MGRFHIRTAVKGVKGIIHPLLPTKTIETLIRLTVMIDERYNSSIHITAMLGETSANNDENIAIGGIVRRLTLILYDRRRLFLRLRIGRSYLADTWYSHRTNLQG